MASYAGYDRAPCEVVWKRTSNVDATGHGDRIQYGQPNKHLSVCKRGNKMCHHRGIILHQSPHSMPMEYLVCDGKTSRKKSRVEHERPHPFLYVVPLCHLDMSVVCTVCHHHSHWRVPHTSRRSKTSCCMMEDLKITLKTCFLSDSHFLI